MGLTTFAETTMVLLPQRTQAFQVDFHLMMTCHFFFT